MKNSVFRKVTVIMSAMLAIGIASTTAFAALPDSLPNLDESTKGSLTVHKYQTDKDYAGTESTGTKADADNINPDKASPLANIDFTIFKIGDSSMIGTEAQDYDESQLSYSETDSKWYYGNDEEVVTITTDENGLAVFEDLDLGRYLIVETYAPQSVIERTAPFFVDVPMTDVTTYTSWIYDIDVYPKNVTKYDTPNTPTTSITKIGNKHETASVGDTLTWIIESGTPTTLNDYSLYVVSDTLDDNLSYVADSLVVTWGESYDTAEVVSASDYDLTVVNGGEIKVSFTEDYLAGKTPSTDEVTYCFYVTYNTTLLSASFDENGLAKEIADNAAVTYSYINQPAEDTGVKTSTENAEVHSGGLKFTKTDEAGNALAGAEFKIATSLENAKNGVFVKNFDGTDMTATSQNGTGYVEFTGLKYGTTGNAVTEGTTTYYVVETKAPTGYQLLTEPKAFEISYDSYSTNYASSARLVNNQGTNLPLTGSQSALIYIFGGAALVSLACVLLVKPKSKKQ